jgi:AraC-like DNA-binding protein
MPRPSKVAAASSRVIPRVLRLLEQRGMNIRALTAELKLPSDATQREELALTPQDFDRLIAAGARALGEPLLALRLPGLLEWPSYSVGELAAHSSPTLREAFARVVRFGSLFYAHLAFACEEVGQELVLTQRLRSGGPGGRYGNEYGLASSLFHARSLSGVHIQPRRVFFAHAAPAERREIEEYFAGSEVAFRRGQNGIAFTLADADRVLPTHDARLLATAEQLAERALGDAPPAHDFVATLAARIRAALPEGAPSASALARRLRLGTRTLQRRLEDQGTSFKELVDQVRRDAALEALRDGALPLFEVAQRAGFADVASFSRAFRRWFGCAPGAYRLQQAARTD